MKLILLSKIGFVVVFLVIISFSVSATYSGNNAWMSGWRELSGYATFNCDVNYETYDPYTDLAEWGFHDVTLRIDLSQMVFNDQCSSCWFWGGTFWSLTAFTFVYSYDDYEKELYFDFDNGLRVNSYYCGDEIPFECTLIDGHYCQNGPAVDSDTLTINHGWNLIVFFFYQNSGGTHLYYNLEEGSLFKNDPHIMAMTHDPDAANNIETCIDNVDNDGDELVDCEDPDCFDVHDPDDEPICPEIWCSDGVDNDIDGYTDMEDPDCYLQPDEGLCPANQGSFSFNVVDPSLNVFPNWFNPSAVGGSDGCCGDDFNPDAPPLSFGCSGDWLYDDCEDITSSNCDSYPGCSLNAECVGTPTPCSSIDISDCENFENCNVDNTCVDAGGFAPYSCSELNSQSECTIAGCSWNDNLNPAQCGGQATWYCSQMPANDCPPGYCEVDNVCVGSRISCSAYTEPDPCFYEGCNWLPTCTGDLEYGSCSEIPREDCDDVPGCTYQLDFGYITSDNTYFCYNNNPGDEAFNESWEWKDAEDDPFIIYTLSEG